MLKNTLKDLGSADAQENCNVYESGLSQVSPLPVDQFVFVRDLAAEGKITDCIWTPEGWVYVVHDSVDCLNEDGKILDWMTVDESQVIPVRIH